MNRKMPEENRATIPNVVCKQPWPRWKPKVDIDKLEKYEVSPNFKKKDTK